MITFLAIVGVLAFCYAHWKLHISIAAMKAELLAEIAKFKG